MGNRLCKRKNEGFDTVDNSKNNGSTFDRIINRLHLRPNAWKSESHLNQKQINRQELSSKDPTRNEILNSKSISKSSDWTDVTLEVPDKEDHIHLRNPKLAFIFNNEEGTPTPPPRKHKKGFREKIEAVAKSGLQALQPKEKKPVEEPLAVKKKINYSCPICDRDEADHNRDHHHHNHIHNHKNENKENKPKSIESKRRKNPSVVSLPNYNDLKLTVADFDDKDLRKDDKKHISTSSLTNEQKKQNAVASPGKLDNYITRCRSFGSLFPQNLKGKLKTKKLSNDIESDDSFGPMEDWDLRIIEHYNPKDASLPRARKIENDKNILSDIENMVVQEEETIRKPKPVARKNEALAKKINKEVTENTRKIDAKSPLLPTFVEAKTVLKNNLPTEENEHSSLIKILEDYSIKDKQKNISLDEETLPDLIDDTNFNSIQLNSNETNFSSLSPSLKEFENNLNNIQDFLNAERSNIHQNDNKNKNIIIS